MNCPICEEEMEKIEHENFTEYKCSDCGISEVKANGNLNILFTGSGVLINQLEKYENEIPFVTEIKKINKYYTLT